MSDRRYAAKWLLEPRAPQLGFPASRGRLPPACGATTWLAEMRHRTYGGDRNVISTSRLTDSLVRDWVAFDQHGNPLEIEIPGDIGPAALLVSPVTEAVKRVEGDNVVSLDRDQMWLVEAIVLNRVVLRRLEDQEMTAEDLLTAVREKGYSWQISPFSSP